MIPGIATVVAGVAVAMSGAHAAAPPVHTGRLPAGQAAIYTDFRHAGFSRIQTAGIMANAFYESTFNVENHAMDSNGFRGYGLFSWNSEFYPTASGLVTGNVARDTKAQVQFVLHHTNNLALGTSGKTAYQVGGNWARYVEICVNCEPGRKQWLLRSHEASVIQHEAA
jgi:hypothetical protein